MNKYLISEGIDKTIEFAKNNISIITNKKFGSAIVVKLLNLLEQDFYLYTSSNYRNRMSNCEYLIMSDKYKSKMMDIFNVNLSLNFSFSGNSINNERYEIYGAEVIFSNKIPINMVIGINNIGQIKSMLVLEYLNILYL